MSLAAAATQTRIPVFSSGARLGFALALAELVVPIFIACATFDLKALAVAGLSVEEILRGADLDVALAFAFVEVEVLGVVTRCWRADPVTQVGVPLRVCRLLATWLA